MFLSDERVLMDLNTFRDEAGEFLQAIDPAGEEPVSAILDMLDREYAELKTSLDNDARLSHQIYDVMFLLFELAARYNLDLDEQWENGKLRKEEKYVRAGKL